MASDLEKLVGDIAAIAALPLDRARSLPPRAYRDEALFDYEMRAIHALAWHCVGHISELPKRGDRLSAEITGEPVFIVRDDGGVRAFSNLCRHRSMRLVEDCGRGGRLVCPYHGWTYDLQGQLIAAPFIDRSTLEEGDRQLPRLACTEWMGWIYVSLAAQPEPPGPSLAGLAALLEPYDPAGMTLLWRHAYALDVNWKSIAENFMESYHVSVVHPETVHRGTPTSSVTCHPGGAGYAYHTLAIRDTESGGPAGIEILACVFPTQIISLTPGTALWVNIEPVAAEKTRAVIAMAVSDPYVLEQGGDREQLAHNSWAYVDRLNNEDKAILTKLHAGLGGRHAASGRLSLLEQPIWEFIRYLAARLNP